MNSTLILGIFNRILFKYFISTRLEIIHQRLQGELEIVFIPAAVTLQWAVDLEAFFPQMVKVIEVQGQVWVTIRSRQNKLDIQRTEPLN